jgi:hypothetical protein
MLTPFMTVLEIMWNEQVVAKNEISQHLTGGIEVSNKTVDKIDCVRSLHTFDDGS